MSDASARLVVDPWRAAIPVMHEDLCTPGVVELIFARVDAAFFGPNLNPFERSRAVAIRDDTARSEFVTGRGLLRDLAGRVMGIDPRRVQITRHCVVCDSTEHGKPVILGDGAPHISVAHRAGHVVVAACLDGPLGVDVEVDRSVRELRGMADLVLTDDECRRLDRLDDAAACSWFLTWWCVKEAVTKRSGVGLSADFKSLRADDADFVAEFSDDYAPPGLLGAIAAPQQSRRARWRVPRDREHGA